MRLSMLFRADAIFVVERDGTVETVGNASLCDACPVRLGQNCHPPGLGGTAPRGARPLLVSLRWRRAGRAGGCGRVQSCVVGSAPNTGATGDRGSLQSETRTRCRRRETCGRRLRSPRVPGPRAPARTSGRRSLSVTPRTESSLRPAPPKPPASGRPTRPSRKTGEAYARSRSRSSSRCGRPCRPLSLGTHSPPPAGGRSRLPPFDRRARGT